MNDRNCLQTFSGSLAMLYIAKHADLSPTDKQIRRMQMWAEENCDYYSKAYITAKYGFNAQIFPCNSAGNFLDGFYVNSTALRDVKHSDLASNTAINLTFKLAAEFINQPREDESKIAAKAAWWISFKDNRQSIVQHCLLAATVAFTLYKYRCGTFSHSTIVPIFLMSCAMFGLPKFVERRIDGLRDLLDSHLSKQVETCAKNFYENTDLSHKLYYSQSRA